MLQIFVGILAGGALAAYSPSTANQVAFLGDLFVSALKAIAPVLVFVLVAASIANQQTGSQTNMGPIVVLYLIGTFAAALTAVLMSFAFPTSLILIDAASGSNPPQGISEVLNTLLFKLVDNPVNALINANYIGILAWGVGLGVVLRHASAATKTVLHDVSHGYPSWCVLSFVWRPLVFSAWWLLPLLKPDLRRSLPMPDCWVYCWEPWRLSPLWSIR